MTNTEGKTYVLERWHGPVPPDKEQYEPQHRIALTARQEDFDCVFLASRSVKLKTIAQKTGLSISQVHYRLKAAGLSVNELREGRGPYADMLRDSLNRQAAKQMVGILRQQLNRKLLEK